MDFPDDEENAMDTERGPLRHLIGEWEGEGGLYSSCSHAEGKVLKTPYLEKVTMKAFGPVQNGKQSL